MIKCDGAPFDQGRKQGTALRFEVERTLRCVRARYGWLEGILALRRARRGPGLALARHLPQQHERLQGIARGAHVSLASLELFQAAQRVSGVGACKGAELEATLDIPAELHAALTLRHSVPDAGGVASIELTAAPWAGCLAGVNAAGLALVCLEDRGRREPPLRALAQDLLFRAHALRPGIEHLRRRAAYSGGSGVLLLIDAQGDGFRAELRSGQLSLDEGPSPGALALEPTLRIDAVARTLIWRDPAGREHQARIE